MKKIFLLSLLLLWLTITWCSSKLSQDNLFEKKQECANKEAEIRNEIYNIYKDFVLVQNWTLEEIFYSSTKSSCLYVAVSENWLDKDIRDFFTKELYISKSKWLNINWEFEIKLQELKWE